MSSQFHCYFIGLGALGGAFAAQILKHNPSQIEVIAKEERAQRLKSGITVNGKHFPLTVVDSPSKKADLIIIAVKYPQLEEAIADIKPFVSSDTLIMPILNGLYSKERLIEVFGNERVIPAFGISMDCSKSGNNIYYKNLGRLVFGDENNIHKSQRVLRIEKFFQENQLPHEVPVDMNRAMWFKFMLNAGVNQASSHLGMNFSHFQKDGEPRELMKAAAHEVLEIAKRKGIDLRDDDIDLMVETINKLDPEGKTSMLQDIEAQRITEVDYFSGHIIKMGKELGIKTPVNEMLYQSIKNKEK